MDMRVVAGVGARILHRPPPEHAFDSVDRERYGRDGRSEENPPGDLSRFPIPEEPAGGEEGDPVPKRDREDARSAEALPGVYDEPGDRGDDDQAAEVEEDVTESEARKGFIPLFESRPERAGLGGGNQTTVRRVFEVGSGDFHTGLRRVSRARNSPGPRRGIGSKGGRAARR